MFFKLFSIEWKRVTRRPIFWLTFVLCGFYIGLGQSNFYTSNQTQLFTGEINMPGLSFDLASSLDVLFTAELPFLLLLTAQMVGADYAQRTNQHWLKHGHRRTSLFAKFSVMAIIVFLMQGVILLVGGGVGFYYKTFVYAQFSWANVNPSAILLSMVVLTVLILPYLGLTMVCSLLTRSTFGGLILGFGLTQFVELLLQSFFYWFSWIKWLPRSLYLSGTYMLNLIGNKQVFPPDNLFYGPWAMVIAAIYALFFLGLAISLYSRQDLGV